MVESPAGGLRDDDSVRTESHATAPGFVASEPAAVRRSASAPRGCTLKLNPQFTGVEVNSACLSDISLQLSAKTAVLLIADG